MAGDEQELGLGPCGGNWARLLEKLGGLDGAEFFGEAEGEHGIGLEAEECSVGMIVHGATGPIRKVGCVPNVIPVSVGEEQSVGFNFFLLEEIQKSLWGIDGEKMPVEIEEVGVSSGEAAGEDQGDRHMLV